MSNSRHPRATAAGMIRRDTPAPRMQPAPPLLDLRTVTQRHPHEGSPRHIANIQKGRTRVKRIAHDNNDPNPRETHLGHTESVTARGGGNEPSSNKRISHDLSLAPDTRHSVVDNMLMSFDQPDLYSTFAGNSVSSSNTHGHVRSSSTNSDFTFPSDASSARYSTQSTRGRRSNSSSNFQFALGRIDSVGIQDRKDSARAKVFQAQRAGAGGKASIPPSRGGRKSNKSSGSSSVDLGQMMNGTRWQHPAGGRSSSFDYGQSSRGAQGSLPKTVTDAHGVPSLSSSNIYDNTEAAPTPTVPAGPSARDRSPVHPPQPTYAPPQAPLAQRKNSSKSSKSHYTRRNKGEVRNIENPTTSGMISTSKQRESELTPPLPTLPNPRANSPTRMDHNSVSASGHGSILVPKDQARDRPGFFRRVFGSSRNATAVPNDSPQEQPFQSSIRADSHAGYTIPPKLSKPIAVEDGPYPSKQPAPPPLVKKPSSFFRRRKRSVAENNPPPVLALHLRKSSIEAQAQAQADRALQTSPSMSSLRRLMTPYLSNSQQLQHGRHTSDTEEFETAGLPAHASYTESFVNPALPLPLKRPTLVAYNSSSSRDRASLKRENPSARGDPTDHDSFHATTPEKSFLLDNSSGETKPVGNSDRVEPVTPRSALLNRTAPSLPVDMASRNEKENPKKAPVNLVAQQLQSTMNPGMSPKGLSPRNTDPLASSNPYKSGSQPLGAQDWLAAANLTPTEKKDSLPASLDTTNRVHIEPVNSNEDGKKVVDLDLPVEAAQLSPASDYQSASSRQPISRASVSDDAPNNPTQTLSNLDSPKIDLTVPTEDDRIQANKVYDEDESVTTHDKAAGWLGEDGPERIRVRRAYMELFDWQNLNILAALRGLCGKLMLKGETQQVDRVLDSFSARWCACNPNHGFKATDVVHTICYSILMLNTDLHLAEIEQKMTRVQFIKNTLPTIRRVAADTASDSFENPRASTLPTKSWRDSAFAGGKSPTFPSESTEPRRSFEGRRPTYRLSSRPSDQSGLAYNANQTPTALDYDTPVDDCGPLVKAPFHGKLNTWEVQVEVVLKDFFNSIRQNRLPLHGNDNQESALDQQPPSNSLSTITGNLLRRTPSMLSKAGSENQSYRGRASENRLVTGRWTSKGRSRPRLYPASTIGSSRTSLEDQSSTWSPSVSSTWSKYSLGKTQTSMSVDSFASDFPQGDFKKSVGFANALSQAIIREDASGGEPTEETIRAAPLLEDESLELAGAPWAKEGILKHKHHLDSVDKRSKDRNWVESFAVIERGWIRLFSFSVNSKSMRQKAKTQKALGGVVGGGNWTDSAEALGTFLLRQTIASALPPPGYSKNRPHVWALSLPTGAVHLFQVGTPDIVKEFVSTANYWSARLSKEPLVGGISNVEYGWGEALVNSALLQMENNIVPLPTTGSIMGSRPSLQSSIRSSLDQGNSRPKLPGDKIVINEWIPPSQSMVASVLMEVDQLKALCTYVKNIEEDLQRHNELRTAMSIAFSSRHPNSIKAMANWERKSSYLLREIVKFRTYIDVLQAAQIAKDKLHASRALPAEGDEEGEASGISLADTVTI